MALNPEFGGTQQGPEPRPCGCIQCQEDRFRANPNLTNLAGMDRYFRYACELCGNKRCPHHTNHRLACSNSNLPGQIGSIYE